MLFAYEAHPNLVFLHAVPYLYRDGRCQTSCSLSHIQPTARRCPAQSQPSAVDHRAELQGQMGVKCLYQVQFDGSRLGRKKNIPPFTFPAQIFPAGLGFEMETF